MVTKLGIVQWTQFLEIITAKSSFVGNVSAHVFSVNERNRKFTGRSPNLRPEPKKYSRKPEQQQIPNSIGRNPV